MEILFCDICNESVPQSDLDRGRAFVRKGRVVCATCDHAMGGGLAADALAAKGAAVGGGVAVLPSPPATAGAAAPPERAAGESGAAATAPSGGTAGVVVGLAALSFAAIGMWLLVDRVDDVRAEIRGEASLLRDEIGATRVARADLARTVEDRIAALRDDLGREAERLDAASAERASELALALEAAQARATEARDERDALRLRLEEVRAELARTLEQDRQAVSELEATVLFLKDRTIELEENLRTVGAGGGPGVGGGNAGGPSAAPPQPAAPSWERYLADLEDEDEVIRVDAVFALGETKDPKVVPHVLPRLQDEDLFVRMAACQALQDLDARTAVPALIDTLEDERPAVREAAMFALQAITGRDFAFDATASDADRAKRVRSWRDWWEKNGEDFLLGGG